MRRLRIVTPIQLALVMPELASDPGAAMVRAARRRPSERHAAVWGGGCICHEMKDNVQVVEKSPAPVLLPIFRSQQQAELLAVLLGDPELELSLTDLAARTGVPHPSVYREVERAEAAGLVTSRRIGQTRLVRANVESPYYEGLADVLTRAFGVPAVLADAIRSVEGIEDAYIFGSWAARHAGERGVRPVGDIDLLVLGSPDRTPLYEAVHVAEERLGREVQVTVREPGWLEDGSGSFHDTVVGRPKLRLDVGATPRSGQAARSEGARPRQRPRRG